MYALPLLSFRQSAYLRSDGTLELPDSIKRRINKNNIKIIGTFLNFSRKLRRISKVGGVSF